MTADRWIEIVRKVVELLRQEGVKIETPSDFESFFGNVSDDCLVQTGCFKRSDTA